METFDIVTHSKAKFELNKLIIDETITLDEWKSLGQSLRQVEGSVQFWIGDWARFGEKQGFTGKYVSPKVYDELEEITGYSRNTIQHFKHTASMLSPDTRLPELSYSHHRAVSTLQPENQKTFLQKAVHENLTKRELEDEVKQFKNQNNEMTQEETIPKEKRAETDYSHNETLRRLERKRDAENEIIALAKKLKKDFKKENYSIFIQVFSNTLNK